MFYHIREFIGKLQASRRLSATWTVEEKGLDCKFKPCGSAMLGGDLGDKWPIGVPSAHLCVLVGYGTTGPLLHSCDNLAIYMW